MGASEEYPKGEARCPSFWVQNYGALPAGYKRGFAERRYFRDERRRARDERLSRRAVLGLPSTKVMEQQ